MAEPGSDNDIWMDLIASVEGGLKSRLERVFAGPPEYDDRAAAIVFGAMVEQSLEGALATHFVIGDQEARNLFTYSEEGRISTFSAKIALGAALGVYDHRMRHDLTWLKHIRNAFAHARVYVAFHTEAIVLACDQLAYPPKGTDEAPYEGMAKTPRQRYTQASAMISTFLRLRWTIPLRFDAPRVSQLYETLYGPSTSSPEILR
jgi:hypothetical protein